MGASELSWPSRPSFLKIKPSSIRSARIPSVHDTEQVLRVINVVRPVRVVRIAKVVKIVRMVKIIKSLSGELGQERLFGDFKFVGESGLN